MEEPEPVIDRRSGTCDAQFLFGEGETKFGPKISNEIKTFIKDCIKSSIPTIQKFHNSGKFNLPPVVTFYVGTSSTGTFSVNKKVAENRMSYLTDLYLEVMGSFGIREDVAYKLLVQSKKSYKPSNIDRDFYDPAKVDPKASERICSIVITPITTMGKSNDDIGNISGKLIDASSIINTYLVDNVDEEDILKAIESLETYSDIKDLNKTMINARMGSLQDFLNDQLFDDPTVKNEIVTHLNKIAKRSSKNTIATIVSGNVSIILENKKVVKLTESDLMKIVKRVIKEQQNSEQFPTSTTVSLAKGKPGKTYKMIKVEKDSETGTPIVTFEVLGGSATVRYYFDCDDKSAHRVDCDDQCSRKFIDDTSVNFITTNYCKK